jgi:hypothetical protein
VERGNKRLASICAGDELDGPADPIASAPSTANGTKLVNGKREKASVSQRKKPTKKNKTDAGESTAQLTLFKPS